MTIHRLAAAACAAALLVLPVPAPAAATPATSNAAATRTAAPAAASTACYNSLFLLRDEALLRLDPTGLDAEPTPVAEFDEPLDAVAYVPDTRALWAVSGDQVIGFDQTGRVVARLRKPRALIPADPVTAATSGMTGAGAGAGDRWIVRTRSEVVTYRMPALEEISRHALTGPGADILLRTMIADWDIRDGRLYTVVAGVLTRVDPDTGRAAPVARVAGLPVAGTFGAVAIDPQGTLHALHDQTGRLYQIDLADPTAVAGATTVGTATRSDAAVCPQGWDYGDAAGAYPTRRAGNGPRHLITAGLTLGQSVTPERDARKKDADDALAAARPTAEPDGSLTVRVAATNTTGRTALLAAWHDLDGNGRFDDRHLVTAKVRHGRSTVTMRWPATTDPVASMLRIRLYGGPLGYAATAPKPTGPAGSGEVEDHPITVRPVRKPATAADADADQPPTIRDLAGPPAAVPDPGAPPIAVPTPERLRLTVAGTTPSRPDRLPLTWSVFVGLLVPAASVAARAAAKRGSR